jgi:hypothetical protein
MSVGELDLFMSKALVTIPGWFTEWIESSANPSVYWHIQGFSRIVQGSFD